MPSHDFQTLNDKEFEELSRDLINRKLGLSLQSFKRGRDKGIDLRSATPANSNSIIGQAKHYYLSGYKALLKTLKKEVKKVKELKPDRYILTTSVPLSAALQTEIKNLFSPYILTEDDVIGNETLNSWLGEFPEIEKSHFKLWLSSSTIIETILNRAVIGRSQFYYDEIKTKISLYVPTNNLNQALKILHDKKVLIISGEPGIGKSTLADILCLKLMTDEYSLYKIETIKEGEESIITNEKQLFYFDDFLGAIYLELTLSGGQTDSKLNSFIQRIRKTPNKLLIFTSRTIILNQAFAFYEKFKTTYSNKENIEIKLADYSNYNKALILYNHIYFRKLKEEQLDVFYEDELYLKIVKHKNYSPRIIDFISDQNKIEIFSKDEYRDYIIETLENPADIWEPSFQHQINDEQRFLIFTIFSFQENIAEEKALEDAYNSRLDYEIKFNGYTRGANSFLNSIKILLNGFIVRRVYVDGVKKVNSTVSYINPSLADFVKNYLAKSEEERLRMIHSFIYIEQFEKLNAAIKEIPRSDKEVSVIGNYFLEKELLSLKVVRLNVMLIRKSKCFLTICNKNNDDILVKLFKQIKWNESIYGGLIYLIQILNAPKKVLVLHNYVKVHFNEIICCIIKHLDDYEDHIWIKDLFEKYDQNLEKFMKNEDNKELLFEKFQDLFNKYKDEKIDELKETITNRIEARHLESDLDSIASDIDDSLFKVYGLSIDIDYDVNWDSHINENIESNYEPDFDYDPYEDSKKTIIDEDGIMRDLFDRE